MCIKIVLLASVLLQTVHSLNILVSAPFPTKSHFLSFSQLFKGLAYKGHNVTVISYYPDKNPLPNYRDVTIGNVETIMKKLSVFTEYKNIKKGKLSTYLLPLDLEHSGNDACENFFSSKAVKKFLQEENEFDLIIFEDFFLECMWPIVQKYGRPVIRFVSHTLFAWNGRSIGNPLASAYVQNVYLIAEQKMSFFGRLENSLMNFVQILFFEFFVMANHKQIAKKYDIADETTFNKKYFNTSLVLLNTHYTFQQPRPLVPNMIEVGGIHIGEAHSLPKEIENWINDSKYGVIYFSFGSVVKGHTMPEEKRIAFLNAFKRLPQRVIWKWESDKMEGKSDNIMIAKWLPQFDILSHPNVKAFISHGGLLGTLEAVHCGVPVMVMPQFGDQHTNAKSLENNGGGVILYMEYASEETIFQSLKKILEPSFQAQAKQLSERFRDRPMPPLETAIYWVEYVARHKGAHFMKTAAVDMPFYQYYLLDVIAFITIVILLILFLIYSILRFFFRKIKELCSQQAKQKKS